MRMPGRAHDLGEERNGALAVGGVGGPHVDAEDHLQVLVGDDVGLVAVETTGLPAGQYSGAW